MIGLDTNVVIRYVTQDDPLQSRKANRLFEERLSRDNPGYLSLITLVEVVWVLESCYGQSKREVIAVIQGILSTKQLVVEHADVSHQALERFKLGKGDFSDSLIVTVCEHGGCSQTLTFDKKAKTIGMTLL